MSKPSTQPNGAAAETSWRRARWRAVAVDGTIASLLFVLSFWQNLTHIPATKFNPDETRWLNRAHYARDLFDPSSTTWRDHYVTRGQPPFGSYVVGVGLLLQGRDLETNGVWKFSYDDQDEYQRNVREGNMASAADLEAGRRTSAATGALTVVVLYFLAKRLSNRVGGVAAGLFVAVHPFNRYLSSLATSDATFGLLIALSALAAAWLAARPSWPRALLLGVLLGFGGATKLSPLFVTVPVAGLGVVLLGQRWWDWRMRRVGRDTSRGDLGAAAGDAGDSVSRPYGWWPARFFALAGTRRARLGVMLVAVPVIAVVTFVAIYPYLWSDPIGRTEKLLDFRVREMRSQATRYSGLAVETRTEALQRVGEVLGTRYSTGSRLVTDFGARFDRDWETPPLDLPLALVGAELFVVLAVSRGLRSEYALVAVVLGGQVAITIMGMRSEFDRYHIPMLVAAAVCIGLLVGQGWLAAQRLTVWLTTRIRANPEQQTFPVLPAPAPFGRASVPAASDAATRADFDPALR